MKAADRRVATRYGLPIRLGTPAAALILALAMLRGPAGPGAAVVEIVLVCLAVAILAYRVEITPNHVSVRRFPFHTRIIPMGDIVDIVQRRAVVLVTHSGRDVPLWGLSPWSMPNLMRALPERLRCKLPPEPRFYRDERVDLRRHIRRSLHLGAALVTTLAASALFVGDNPLRAYAASIGKYVFVLCFLVLLAFVIQSLIAWTLRAYNRELEETEMERRRRKAKEKP